MTEELNTIQTVDASPFKHLIMTIGELPTSFVDSMTYYEMLAWLCNYIENTVIPAVNNNAEATEELQAAFVELKSYVDNYFENLDVQEEINNKLDELVEDGTLENLIGAYIQPRIDEQNAEIANFETTITNATAQSINEQNAEISSFKSSVNNALDSMNSQITAGLGGTPLTASSTSEMTDTSRVYVNTTDGKWYYYDGDSWEIGGTYQSTAIAPNSINLENIDASIRYDKYTRNTFTASKGGVNPSTGEPDNTQTNRCRFDITDITSLDSFYIKCSDTSLVPVALFKYENDHYNSYFSANPENSDFVTTVAGGFMVNRTNFDEAVITFRKSDSSAFTDDEVSALSLTVIADTKNADIENTVNSMKIDTISFTQGGIQWSTGITNTANTRARTGNIKFETNTGYKYFKVSGLTTSMTVAGVVKYLNDTYVGYSLASVKNSIYIMNNGIKINCDSTFNQIAIVITKFDGSVAFTESEIANLKVTCIDSNYDVEETVWKGKKYVALGDSITYGFIPRNYAGYPGQLKSYAQLTSEKLGLSFTNAGVSGNTVAPATGGGTPMCERYVDLPNDADLITVMGGTNDIRKGVVLGQMSDRTDATFYGSLHILFGGLYKKYFIDQGTTEGKKKHIVAITPIKMLYESSDTQGGTGTLYDLEPWCNAIKEVATYYSIPVLDMYNLSNINPHLNETVQGTETGYTGYYNPYITDGTHPTQEGAAIMADVLTGYLKTLM